VHGIDGVQRVQLSDLSRNGTSNLVPTNIHIRQRIESAKLGRNGAGQCVRVKQEDAQMGRFEMTGQGAGKMILGQHERLDRGKRKEIGLL
jgi:hypothetical protein